MQTVIRSLWVNFFWLRIGPVATLAFTSKQAGLWMADAASRMCGLMLRLQSWFTPFGAGDEAKACLKTVEGVRWTMTKEEKAATTKRKKATVTDLTGFF